MRKKGFTLIELLVCIIIVAILSSISVLWYGRFIERMRMGEADTLIGTMIASQERTFLRLQRYTPYWHQLDAAPIAVRVSKDQNDFANGKENTIFFTRGGVLSGVPNEGFAVSFEQDATGRWFVVAQRVGKGEYTYHLVRPFDDTQTFCVPVWDNQKDLDICVDYMGVEGPGDLSADPRVPELPEEDE